MVRRYVVLLPVVVMLALVAGNVGVGALDEAPTKIAAKAKALGITKAGHRYRYHEEQSTGDEGRLTIDAPVPWSDTADSVFRRPDTNEPYGVGVRVTTDAQKWHDTFDVPGYRITLTSHVPADPDSLLEPNATSYDSCRALGVKPFDNGKYHGSYELFAKCDGTKTAGIVVAATDERGSTFLLLAGTAVTKADLKAFDRALSGATLEKTSV